MTTKSQKNELSLQKFNPLKILLRQIKNPLLIVLVIATAISFILGEKTNSLVIFIMVIISVGMGFFNEFQAEKTVSDLLKKISLKAIIVRDERKIEIPVRDIRIDDIVLLSPGSIVPADSQIISANQIEIDESVLTGESLPVSKTSNDTVYMGSVVTSGETEAKVIAIGNDTKFGKISADLSQTRPETNFEKGLSNFSNLLVKVIAVMCVVIFIVNTLLGHSFITSLLFALAIAIGLTPELFPVIITVSLAHGSKILAKKKVVVKQLIAIENLGNMDILCSDKTGTLTQGKINLTSHIGINGETSDRVLELGLICNSEGSRDKININTIDSAIWDYAHQHHIHLNQKIKKIYSSPFDYSRQIMFSIIKEGDGYQLIAKGSPEKIFAACRISTETKKHAQLIYRSNSQSGVRSVAVATKKIDLKKEYSFKDISNLKLHGFLTFYDQPKNHITDTIKELENLKVKVKIITGDNLLVAKHVCEQVNFQVENPLTGQDIDKMTPEQLNREVSNSNLFCRVNPEQKVLIIKALQTSGHSVGFLGDGINDAPSLHTADVSISVDTAVDVAKDAATIVLLHKDLGVISQGIIEGRKIFANTLKYILMGTSSNFGNMFSAATASFILPFLPMTASQILLNNLLYDLSQLSIPTDSVDAELLEKPEKWDIGLIKKYMFVFGPISTLFDFATFGLMIFVFKATPSIFQTGWFIESLTTQVLVIFLIRTRRSPFFKSKPGVILSLASISIVLIGAIIPFTPLSEALGFTPLPFTYFSILGAFVLVYLTLVEIIKAISKSI